MNHVFRPWLPAFVVAAACAAQTGTDAESPAAGAFQTRSDGVSAGDTTAVAESLTSGGESAAAGAVEPVYPRKLRARRPWEYVVSMPLWIAVGPLYLTYRGAAALTTFVDEHDIPQKVERVLVSDDGTRMIVPTFSARTGTGVKYSKEGLISRDSRLELKGSYGLLHKHGAEAALEKVALGATPLQVDVKALYTFMPDESFYGIGPRSASADQTDFAQREIRGTAAVRMTFGTTVALTAAGGASEFEISHGRSDDYPSVDSLYDYLPGADSRALLGTFGASALIDMRDRDGHTTGGSLIRVDAGFRDEIRQGPFHDKSRSVMFGYWQVGANLKKYLELPWGRNRILVLGTVVEKRKPLDGRAIPFYLLSELGDEEPIRGFHRGRFRDRDRLQFSAEYRYPVWADQPMLLDAVLFTDAGQVSHSIFEEVDVAQFQWGFGGGFRFYNKEKLVLKIAVGFSEEAYRLYFALND